MSTVSFEIAIILFLLAANGIFAMTEIAIVSASRTRLKGLAESGNAKAKIVLTLIENPNRFLSTVQIGITLVGIVAGAFGGATLSTRLADVLVHVPILAPYAQNLAFAIVIGLLTYCSLIVGELLPKRLALLNPEGTAMFMARPMANLATVAHPIVLFLGWSTDSLLRILRLKAQVDRSVTEEDITVLVREGMIAGVFRRDESEMIEGVFSLDRVEVHALMTPRPRILWLRASDSHDAVWHKVAGSPHSYFPVCGGTRDDLLGVVSVKALYTQLAGGGPMILPDLITPPVLVPEHQKAATLLTTFRQTGTHVAFVVDEFGIVVGMVTLIDIMEAIVGDLPSQEEKAAPAIRKRDDGTWLVDAMLDLETIAESIAGFQVPPESGEEYQTLAGLISYRLERLPREGDKIVHGIYGLEVIDMDRHRVDKVLIHTDPSASA